MLIGEEDIREAVGFRPYEELEDERIEQLLDAFEDFLPRLKLFGETVEELIEAMPDTGRASDPGESAARLLSLEPTVSKSLFELLLEASYRLAEDGQSRRSRYEEWYERELFYGFGSEQLEDAFQLRAEHSS